jgi:hypothetical protein
MEFNTVIEQNPVLIGTNPRIISVDTQPRIEIITNNSLRREEAKKVKDKKITNTESIIVRMNSTEFHKTLCHHQIKFFRADLLPPKSEGFNLTRSQIRREAFLKSIKNKKEADLTYNDFSNYF